MHISRVSEQFKVTGIAGALSARLDCPDQAVGLLVFAHGAGADYQHSNMVQIVDAFAEAGLASLRFNFPFMQAGRRRVDSVDDACAAIAAACQLASQVRGDLPLFAGGHSFGGRMCSHAQARSMLDVKALVFGSFPLHVVKKPKTDRASHLAEVSVPMQFLSGTRDALAQADLLEGVVAGLPNAQLHWLETADHGYKILKRTRTNPENVFAEMARVTRAFIDPLLV